MAEHGDPGGSPPREAETRARQLAAVLEGSDRRLTLAGEALAQGETGVLGRLERMCDDMTGIATALRHGGTAVPLIPPRTASPEVAGTAEVRDHPATVDAERLTRETQRSMRRASAPRAPKTDGARTERQVVFVVSFAAFFGIGWFAARYAGELPGDAVARVQAAQATVAGRDRHLEALGFIWGPFPAVFQMPLVWLRSLWPTLTADAVAAVVVSAAFMAGSLVQMLRWGEESGSRALIRLGVIAVVAAHPLIWLFGANGMSEACWIFFMLIAASRLALWAETDDLRHLTVAGLATGMAYLVRYESAAVLAAEALFVALVTWSRWHPRLDDPSFGEPLWEDDRERFQRTLLDVVLLALPAMACIGSWAIASWLIVGEPFPQFTSEYGNSALVEAAGDTLSNIVPDFTNLGRAWFYLVQLAVAAPALVLLTIVALAVRKVSSARVTAALVVFGSPIAVQLMLSFQGSTFPWFRYTISAVVLCGLLALTLGPASPSVRVLGVCVLVPGVLLSWAPTRDGELGVADDALMLDAMVAAARGDDPRPTSLLGVGGEIASWIEAQPDAEPGSVICDAAACFPVLISATRPELYVIPSDRDFEPLAADPPEFGVRYVLMGNPDGTAADAIRSNFPSIWDDGAGIATQVREWGDDERPKTNFRLFRVEEPKGEPRPQPDEEQLG